MSDERTYIMIKCVRGGVERSRPSRRASGDGRDAMDGHGERSLDTGIVNDIASTPRACATARALDARDDD